MTLVVGSLDDHGAIMDRLCVFPSPPTAIKARATIMDSNHLPVPMPRTWDVGSVTMAPMARQYTRLREAPLSMSK